MRWERKLRGEGGRGREPVRWLRSRAFSRSVGSFCRYLFGKRGTICATLAEISRMSQLTLAWLAEKAEPLVGPECSQPHTHLYVCIRTKLM